MAGTLVALHLVGKERAAAQLVAIERRLGTLLLQYRSAARDEGVSPEVVDDAVRAVERLAAFVAPALRVPHTADVEVLRGGSSSRDKAKEALKNIIWLILGAVILYGANKYETAACSYYDYDPEIIRYREDDSLPPGQWGAIPGGIPGNFLMARPRVRVTQDYLDRLPGVQDTDEASIARAHAVFDSWICTQRRATEQLFRVPPQASAEFWSAMIATLLTIRMTTDEATRFRAIDEIGAIVGPLVPSSQSATDFATFLLALRAGSFLSWHLAQCIVEGGSAALEWVFKAGAQTGTRVPVGAGAQTGTQTSPRGVAADVDAPEADDVIEDTDEASRMWAQIHAANLRTSRALAELARLEALEAL